MIIDIEEYQYLVINGKLKSPFYIMGSCKTIFYLCKN